MIFVFKWNFFRPSWDYFRSSRGCFHPSVILFWLDIFFMLIKIFLLSGWGNISPVGRYNPFLPEK
jgi:hypothetical protein